VQRSAADPGPIPVFSVVIPTYGRPRLLNSAVESVLAQTDPSFEVVVVDDASPEPITGLPADPRLRLVRRSRNGGSAAARNTGLDAARGEYVVFLDDDDLMTPDRLELAREGLRRADIAVCRRGSVGEVGASDESLYGDVHDRICDRMTPHLGQTALRRADCPRFDETFAGCEDVDWWIRATRQLTVWTVPSVGYLVRSHDAPRHGNGTRARVAGSRRLLEIHAGYYDAHPRARAFRELRLALLSGQAGEHQDATAAYLRSLRAHPEPRTLAHLARHVGRRLVGHSGRRPTSAAPGPPSPVRPRAADPGDRPAVAVAIPTYRRPALLAHALDSVQRQSFQDLRVTVVDNASGDGTAGLVERRKDSRVRLVSNPETVPRIENYRIALGSASAPFVAILADDDEWEPEFLERAVRLMRDHPGVAIVHTGYTVIDGTGRPLRTVPAPLPIDGSTVDGGRYIRMLLDGRHSIEFTGTLLRGAALPPGGFRTADDVADDIGLLLRTARSGRVAVIAEPLVRVRFHDGTVSAEGSAAATDGRYRITLDYRAVSRAAKLRFVDEYAASAAQRRALRRVVHRSYRRNVLAPSARVLREERDLGRAWGTLQHDVARDPRALLDPAALKRGLAVLAGR
jgi:glycosyltransferase involved in cell wall biosynthesis